MSTNVRDGLGPPQDEVDLQEYFDVLKRRWRFIAATVVGVSLFALLFSLIRPRIYFAVATVAIDRTGSSLSRAGDLPLLAPASPIETLIEVARSRSVAELAAVRLPGGAARDRETVTGIQRRVRVTRVRAADMIRIEARGPSADAAAEMANAVADAFLAWHIEMRRAQASAARDFIESQLKSVSAELRQAEEALASYKSTQGQVSISEQTTLAIEKIAEFDARRRLAATERAGVQAALEHARASLRTQAPTVASALVLTEDPVSAQLRQELARLEVELAGLLEELTPRHPQVITIQARIDELKRRLSAQSTQRVSSSTVSLNPAHQELVSRVVELEINQESLMARERALADVVARYAEDTRQLPVREMALARLVRDAKVAEQTYLLLSERLQEARVAEASVVGDLRIVDRAIPPQTPTLPRHRANAMLGGLLGVLAGVVAAFVVEAVDATFKSPDEVGRALELPVLATIPLQQQNGPAADGESIALATANHPRAPFAEAFRHLRTALLYSSPDRPLRSVLITSAGPGEGKGTVAANLAVGFAQAGRSVWLIECDLRRPGLTGVFQPRTPFGLSELLVDGLALEDALHGTAVDNLQFIPGGRLPPNPAELLGSAKMKSFLERKDSAETLLILDAPPVLPVTDSEVLAPMVDGVLMVVHLGKTPRGAARRAVDQLSRVGARLIGVVVNGAPVGPRRYARYYTYYADDAANGSAQSHRDRTTSQKGGSS